MIGRENQSQSLRDKLLNRNTPIQDEDTDDWLLEEDDEATDTEEDPCCPQIKISKEEKVRIRRPWKQTLIIKLLGRSIGYKTLLVKLSNLWRPKAAMDLVAMDNGFFIVKFSSNDGYNYAKYGGPWMIFNHYLMVRPWQPNFETDQVNLQKNLLVWVHIPCLPIEYYDHNFLMKVGVKIGKPVMIDDTTSVASRGHFARMCRSVMQNKNKNLILDRSFCFNIKLM